MELYHKWKEYKSHCKGFCNGNLTVVISASGWHQKRLKTMVFQTKLPYNYRFDQTE
jgi:hypothetical protein